MNMTITESDKKLLSFLAAFLLAVLFIFLVFRPLSEKNKELKAEITMAKDQEVAMDMSAALADDMAVKETSTQEELSQTMKRFYPMLESQEAENMITVLMLNHNLDIQSLNVTIPDEPTGLNWYQYSENAVTQVVQSSNGLENDVEEQKIDFGIYTAKVICNATGSEKDMMALIDDISFNYPAISILAAEWDDGLTVSLEIYMCEQ